MGDLGGGGPPPLLGEPRPPRLLPLSLSIVVELNAVQSLPPVPATDHCNSQLKYNPTPSNTIIIIICGRVDKTLPPFQIVSLLVSWFEYDSPHLRLSVPSWFENGSPPHLQLIVQSQTWAYSSAPAERPRTFGSHVQPFTPTTAAMLVRCCCHNTRLMSTTMSPSSP